MKRKVITLLLIAILTLTAFGTVALTTSQKVEAANSSAVPATSQKVEAANSSAVPVETPILSAVWSAWTSLSGQLTASPGAVSWADGRTDVFARGTDNALWHRSYNNSSWSSWESLSGQLAAATGPAVSSQAAGKLDVFVIGSDQALWHRSYQNGAWSTWESLGGQFTASPASVSWANGRIDLFGRGSDGALWHRSYNNSAWGTWESLSGQLAATTGPAVSSQRAGQLDVFVIGTDNALWQRSYENGTWSSWKSLSGQLTASPSAVSWGDGRIDVFGRGSDNALWQRSYQNGAWSAWTSLGGQLAATTGPAASSQRAGQLDVFVIGTDNALWHRNYTSSQLAGWRASDTSDGYQLQQPPSYWVNTANTIASNFGGTPSGVWIVGLIQFDSPANGKICKLQFPGTASTYINYTATDESEAYLTAFDAAGLKVWLQVEPADADMLTLIDLVLSQYSHHSCVIGFGVDCEWYKFSSYNNSDSPGKPITNNEASSWLSRVQSYNPNYKLFLKHWRPDHMPSNHLDGIVFIDDSQQFSNYNAMITEFQNWGNSFSDAEVGFQYGYPADKWIWSQFQNPMAYIGNNLISNVSNCVALYWVDFTITTVYPP